MDAADELRFTHEETQDRAKQTRTTARRRRQIQLNPRQKPFVEARRSRNRWTSSEATFFRRLSGGTRPEKKGGASPGRRLQTV